MSPWVLLRSVRCATRRGGRLFEFSCKTTAGWVVGYYVDANNVVRGFLRAPDGAITSFDAPAQAQKPTRARTPKVSTRRGEINGFYVHANNVYHGFVRAPDGTITPFEPEGSGTGPGQGAASCTRDCINPARAISASYLDDSNVNHAFVRAPDGTIITYNVPGAGTGPFQGSLQLWDQPGMDDCGSVH